MWSAVVDGLRHGLLDRGFLDRLGHQPLIRSGDVAGDRLVAAIPTVAVRVSLDLDAEMKIYISGNPVPIVREFKKGTDIVAVQKTLAEYIVA